MQEQLNIKLSNLALNLISIGLTLLLLIRLINEVIVHEV